jgi:hypothetical protein
VHFDPVQTGSYSDALGLQTTGGSGQVGLSASAGTPGALQIANLSNDFGSVALGTSLTKSFTITNTGGTAVPITKSKPPIGGEFAATTSLPEGTTIQAGEAVTEQVSFQPTALGAATGEWDITGEDTSGPHVVLFTGIGATPSSPSAPSGSASGSSPAIGVAPFKQAPNSPLARLAGASFKESRAGTVAMRVSCPATSADCSGRLTLRGALATPASAGGSRAKRRLYTLASATFTMRGGHTQTITLKLSRAARAGLARVHLLRARAILAERDSLGAMHTLASTVTLHWPGLPKAKH